MSEIVELNDIGPVLLTTPPRAKRLSIKVRPFKGIEVCIPKGTPPAHVAAFIKKNKQWMKKALEKIRAKEEQLTIFDENSKFSTRSFALKIEPDNISDVKLKLKDGILHVRYPSHMNVKTQSIQSVIRFGIEEALRAEAKLKLPERVNVLSRINGFSYNKVFIKNLKSRWGSCSNVNNINLNLHLMRLPEHLIDYVILHELCHTKEKNHGPGFWNLMHQVTNGKAKMYEKEMKNQKTVIY